jgi:glycosyltransferase involved in cell wall biosynthesis
MSNRIYFIGIDMDGGTIPEYFHSLANELVKRGNKVIILQSMRCAKESTDPTSNPQMITWPSKRPVNMADGIFLYQLIKEHHPQCLIGNFGAVNIMMIVGWLTRVPCRIAWYHTLSKQIFLDWQASQMKLFFLQMRKRMIFYLASYVIGNSRAAVSDFHTNYHIPDRKSSHLFYLLQDPGATRVQDHSGQKKIILCSSRFYYSKGQDVLLTAIERVRRKNKDIHVIFLGDGPMLEDCKKYAQERGIQDVCEFLGTIPHEEVAEHMKRAYVSVVPSRSESFGLVALESMAVATPVIVSEVGGLVEFVQDGIDGYVIPPEDPELLAEKLLLLLDDPELQQQLGKNARDHFLTSFDQKRMVGDQVDWVEHLVSGSIH